MGFTTLKAIVNMTADEARLINWERGALEAIVAPHACRSLENWNVPWCTSPGEFSDHHLSLSFAGIGYEIWQENTEGYDAIRFNLDGRYGRPGIPPPYNSILLASTHEGGVMYATSTNSEAILVIDDRLWVIMYRIATG